LPDFSGINTRDTIALQLVSFKTLTIASLAMATSTATQAPAANLRSRKSESTVNSDNIANGQSTALLKINAVPTEHGQEMDKQLDEHQS
jgi:hypothetical protein